MAKEGPWPCVRPRPPAAEGLVARTPGKETLPFRSDGLPGEWRPGLSPRGGRAARQGPGLRLAAGGSRACAGPWRGAQVSGLRRTRRARVGRSRCLAVGGARGGTEGTRSVGRCSGLERGGGRSGAAKVPGMEGAVRRPWRRLWAPGGPSEIIPRSRARGAGPDRGCSGRRRGWSGQILETGILLRSSVVLPSSLPGRTGAVSRVA